MPRLPVLRALAQCCQGNSQKAEETLKNINPYKLREEDKLEYYLLMSELCFAKGEEMRVAEFERVYLTGVEKNQREQKCFQRFCTNNHRLWAMKNKDYPAAHRFLSEQRALSGRKCEKYSVIKYSMLEAEIHAGLGETKSAAGKGTFAKVRRGWRKRILKKIPLSADKPESGYNFINQSSAISFQLH